VQDVAQLHQPTTDLNASPWTWPDCPLCGHAGCVRRSYDPNEAGQPTQTRCAICNAVDGVAPVAAAVATAEDVTSKLRVAYRPLRARLTALDPAIAGELDALMVAIVGALQGAIRVAVDAGERAEAAEAAAE
jgi:hypothetical protein